MADSNPFSAEQWLTAQRKYWDAWTDLTRSTLGASPAAKQPEVNPWAEALNQWWKATAPGASPTVQDFYERLTGLGKGFFTLGETLSGAYGEAQTANEAVNQWLGNLQKAFSGTAETFGKHPERAMREFKAFWDLPLDTFQRAVSSFSPLPGDFLQALHPDSPSQLSGEMRAHLDRFLSIPGVGHSRESQQQYQDLARLVLDYQSAMYDYAAALNRVGLQSTQRFQQQLEEASTSEQPISTLRDFYGRWVDACEEVYADFAMSDDYAKLYGRLVNTLMAVKHQGAVLVDEGLEAMNMPTRRELSTVHKRLQAMRREFYALRAEVEALRERLPGAPEPSPPAKAAPRQRATATTSPRAATGRARKPATGRKQTTATRKKSAATRRKSS